MSIYLIGAINVHDAQAYQPYMEGAFASVISHGVEALAYGTPQVIEGSLPAERIILLKFATQADFETWYKSDAYQKVRPIRLANADTPFLVTMPGLDTQS